MTQGAAPEAGRRVERGDVVGYRYRIQNESKRLLGVCSELTHYLHGGLGTQPPSLESQMNGRMVGDLFTASLESQQDFGDLGWRRLLTLPRSRFPKRMQHHLEPGMRVDTKGLGAGLLALWIVSANESDVVFDFDPPGRTLRFAISVVSIRRATKAEVRCGYPARWNQRVASSGMSAETR